MQSSQSRSMVSSWELLIDEIDSGLAKLRAAFAISFAEGVNDPRTEKNPRESVKLFLFDQTWSMLTRAQAKSFADLAALDHFFNTLYANHKKFIGDLTRAPAVSKVYEKCKLSDADTIPENKIALFGKVMQQFHALIRLRYIIAKLVNKFTPDQCMDQVSFLKNSTDLNSALLYKLDIENCYQSIVDPLKMLNENLIRIVHEKGYGLIVIEGLQKITGAGKPSDTIFLPLYKNLENLPHINEMAAVVRGEANNTGFSKQHLLTNFSLTIADTRVNLRQTIDVLLADSHQKVDEFAEHCSSLKQISDKIAKMQAFDEFFNLLLELRKVYQGNMLFTVAEDLANACNNQSIVDKIPITSLLYKSTWGEANAIVVNVVDGISASLVKMIGAYNESYNIYNTAVQEVYNQQAPMQTAFQLVQEWQVVNHQTDAIVTKCVELLGEVAVKVTQLAQTPVESFLIYAKRHWPELLTTPLVTGGASAGVVYGALTLSVVAAPLVVVVGVAVGIPVALGAGAIRDRFFPSAAVPPPSVELLPETRGAHEGRRISERIFGTDENPRLRLDEAAPEALLHPAPPAATAPATGFASWLPNLRPRFVLWGNAVPPAPTTTNAENDEIILSVMK
jgi:hypothetical protein